MKMNEKEKSLILEDDEERLETRKIFNGFLLLEHVQKFLFMRESEKNKCEIEAGMM